MKTNVIFNGEVVRTSENLEEQIMFALSLHRESNVSHSVAVSDDVDTYLNLYVHNPQCG